MACQITLMAFYYFAYSAKVNTEFWQTLYISSLIGTSTLGWGEVIKGDVTLFLLFICIPLNELIFMDILPFKQEATSKDIIDTFIYRIYICSNKNTSTLIT